MNIRKMTLKVQFLYDADSMRPQEWPLRVVAGEIEDGECIGQVETLSDEPMTREQVREQELEWGGDGGFMLPLED